MTIKIKAMESVRGFRFISLLSGSRKLIDQIGANFVLHIENQSVGSVRAGNDVLAGIAATLGQGFEIGALFIDAVSTGGGIVGQLLAGKEEGAGGGVGNGAVAVGLGGGDSFETFSSGKRVGGEGVGPGFENSGIALLGGAHNLFKVFGHLDRRMDVLQADKNDTSAQAGLVGLSLDVNAKALDRGGAAFGHQVVEFRAGQVTGDFTFGDAGEEADRVFIDVGPSCQIGDLILHRNADGEEINGRAFDIGRPAGLNLRVELAAGDKEIEFLGVSGGPGNSLAGFRFRADDETLDEVGVISNGAVNGPGQLEVEAGSDDAVFAQRAAKTLEESLIARLDNDKTGGKHQGGELGQKEPAEGAFEETIKPRFGNFEAKLVIEGVGGGGDDGFGLAEQTDEAAFVEEAGVAAFHADAIHFQNQGKKCFDSRQTTDDAQRAADEEIGFGETSQHGGGGGGGGETGVGAEQQVGGAGAKKFLILQTGQAAGV